MANRNGVKWSREETILAYELYCRIPFSKISQSNPEIIHKNAGDCGKQLQKDHRPGMIVAKSL